MCRSIPNNVRMYVCGPTVYDFAHIGNARPVDRLRRAVSPAAACLRREARHLCAQHHRRGRQDQRARGARLSRSAAERGDPQGHRRPRRSSTRTWMRSAACGRPSSRARPSTSPRCATIIDKLIANGNAYVAQDHVLFAVGSMKDYGRLSRRSLDEMVAGARVDVAPYKRGEMDFVLWKPSKPGEPSWPSPGGIKAEGRPGWHIECSAMAWKHLGERVRHPWRRHRSRVSASRERASRRHAARSMPSAWRRCGCTTASCRSKATRCRSRSATSSRSANCWRPTRSAGATGPATCCGLPCCEPTIARRWTGRWRALEESEKVLRELDRPARSVTETSFGQPMPDRSEVIEAARRRPEYVAGDRRVASARGYSRRPAMLRRRRNCTRRWSSSA